MSSRKVGSKEIVVTDRAAWTIFGVAAAVTAAWLGFAAYLVGGWAALAGVPIVLLAFGVACLLVATRSGPTRERHRFLKKFVPAAAFLAALSFVLTLSLGGLGNGAEVHFVATVVDARSGRPVAGASLTATRTGTVLDRKTTDDRGAAELAFHGVIETTGSLVTTTRGLWPATVPIRVEAPGYETLERSVRPARERRIHFLQKPFGRSPRNVLIETILRMKPTAPVVGVGG